jgi:hypothetical protein
MENITTGHWIFAGVFMVLFMGYLVWSYRKDLRVHKLHYSGVLYFFGSLVVVLFLIYVFKRLL